MGGELSPAARRWKNLLFCPYCDCRFLSPNDREHHIQGFHPDRRTDITETMMSAQRKVAYEKKMKYLHSWRPPEDEPATD